MRAADFLKTDKPQALAFLKGESVSAQVPEVSDPVFNADMGIHKSKREEDEPIRLAVDFLTGWAPDLSKEERTPEYQVDPTTGKGTVNISPEEAGVGFLQSPEMAFAAGATKAIKAGGSLASRFLKGTEEAASWATGGATEAAVGVAKGAKGAAKAISEEVAPKVEAKAAEFLKGEADEVSRAVETPKPTEGPPTSTKNAVTEAEREARGLESIEKEIKKTAPAYEEAKTLVAEGKTDPRALAKSIADNPRPISAVEEGVIGHDRVRLLNEETAAEKSIADAVDKGDKIAEAEARAKWQRIQEDLDINHRASTAAGTQWSASGRMRQLQLERDYSLGAMVRKHKRDTGKAPTEAQMTKYESMSREIDDLTAKLAEREGKIAELEAAKVVKRIRKETELEIRQTRRAATKQELSVEFDSLVKDLNKQLGGQLNVGLDPMAIVIVGKLAKNRVKAGIIEAEAIVDSIYTAIKTMGLDISKREIRDAISGYGKTSHPSNEPLKAQLREARAQMRLVSALEDAEAGMAPLKSGYQRGDQSEKVKELTKQVKDAMREAGLLTQRTPEEQWKTLLQAYKTRTTNRINELEGKMAKGDLSVKKRRTLEMDKEALDLKFKREQVVRQFNKMVFDEQLRNRNLPQKLKDRTMEAVNLVRSIKTSMDLSAVLRQGAFIVLGHPVRGLKAMPDMFRALKSEKGQFAADLALKQRPNYGLYEKSKLYLSEHGQKLSQMEEAYMSRWVDKVPGVAASQRAYTMYLNRLRADSFDKMVATLSKDAKNPTKEELDSIANYINVATGRGKIGTKESLSVGMNTILFAPRYVASRFQLLAGQPLYGGTAATRKMIAGEYARFLTGLGVVYGLGSMAGGKIETDPRSSDFGKIRFGNTRIDPLAGLSQSTVLAGRLTSGETKTTTGKVQKIRGEKIPYGGSDSADVIARFLRSKLAPVPAIGVDVATGKNYVGEPIDAKYAAKQVVPLAFGDIYDTMKERGVAAGTALALLSMFGMGIQTYEPKRR